MDLRSTRELLELLFGLRRPVGRGTYARVGVGLMIFKYAVDAGAIWLASGVVWAPLDYLDPSLAHRQDKLLDTPFWLQVALFLWTLPFLWIGVSMTMRRLADAGKSPVLAFLYFFPIVNYLLMGVLCLLPTRPGEREAARESADAGAVRGPLRSALVGTLVGLALALPLMAVVLSAAQPYGLALFAGTPFLMGAVGAWIHNRAELRPWLESAGVALFMMMLASGGLLLFAIEGALCIVMLMPLALAAAVAGALFGRALVVAGELRAFPAFVVTAATAGGGWVESELRAPSTREVTTEIEIGAPPEVVWRHVVSFSELPPPVWSAFRLGIAYPVRARIEGEGVGAVRRCEFSTGDFLEPIVVWDAPRELAFEVAANPPPLHEWSPYRDLHPPHLDGAFRSTWGRFLLTPLEGGRTRLSGTTRYELELEPAPYWQVWSDFIVHRIHRRVLEHVQRLAEQEG